MPKQKGKKDISDFKIFAIRPHVDCNGLYLKAIKAGTLYILNQDFDFKDNFIEYRPSFPYELLNSNGVSVNLSAVVGKNGSGKSSLFELLFAGLYQLAVKEEILDPKKKLAEDNKYNKTNLSESVLGLYEIFFDLYYYLDNRIYKVTIRDREVTIDAYLANKKEPQKFVLTEKGLPFESTNFFYTIAINYSFYALNSQELGYWVKLLFHKNDSYQTPVVINPFRNEGNINVNREKELVHSRMLYALLQPIEAKPEDSLLHMAPGKIAKRVVLILDRKKLNKIKVPSKETTTADFLFKERLPAVYKRFLGDEKFVPQDNLHNFYGQLYIIQKLIAIADTYDTYSKYRPAMRKDPAISKKTNRDALFGQYLDALLADTGHITFKLRRAVHALKYTFYDKNEEDQPIDILKLSKLTWDYSQKYQIPMIELLPPPYLFADIEFDNGSFSLLSSGEKQKIYSNFSIIYHLINLDSVQEGLKRYPQVFCVLDEIELYYHPEMQRTYIKDLLLMLEKIKFDIIRHIDFCFITHSPFILSDIPHNNILYLKINEDGKGVPETITQPTFGANIYDLLSHSFYFEDGFIGDKAQTIIQQVIDNLQPKLPKGTPLLKPEQIKMVIAAIGEPFLRDKLTAMYEKKFQDTNLRQREIDQLKERIKKLEQQPL